MFERFTEEGRRALFFARYEVSQLGGPSIEAEHLLLGILRLDKGPTPRLFAAAGFSSSDARAAIEAHHGPRERVSTSTEIPFTDESKRVLEHAKKEADRLGHQDIGAEHLLLGILHQESSFAANLLARHGLNIESLREYLRNPPAGTPPVSATPPASGNTQWKIIAHAPLDPIASIERIRFLAEQLTRPDSRPDNSPLLLKEIHHHLDLLKRRLASE